LRAAGYLRTAGAQIVDDHGHAVRLTGLSWFGMETSNYAPHGLWTRSMASMLDQIKSLGYNVLRVPYTNQMLDAGATPNGIDFSKNPDLMGLTPIQILDKLVDGAKARGLRIILDRHRPDSSAQSELWYTAQVSEQKWIDDWKTLVMRYKGNPTVVGVDLHNGTKDQTMVDQQWFRAMASYIGQRQLSFAFWCLNPDSGDTGGLLADDWQTVNTDKQMVLSPILAPLIP
jgi:aryl-phospho-beta-D-glucosidase BglC (GH1 family)